MDIPKERKREREKRKEYSGVALSNIFVIAALRFSLLNETSNENKKFNIPNLA